jgi:hypothetical protein
MPKSPADKKVKIRRREQSKTDSKKLLRKQAVYPVYVETTWYGKTGLRPHKVINKVTGQVGYEAVPTKNIKPVIRRYPMSKRQLQTHYYRKPEFGSVTRKDKLGRKHTYKVVLWKRIPETMKVLGVEEQITEKRISYSKSFKYEGQVMKLKKSRAKKTVIRIPCPRTFISPISGALAQQDRVLREFLGDALRDISFKYPRWKLVSINGTYEAYEKRVDSAGETKLGYVDDYSVTAPLFADPEVAIQKFLEKLDGVIAVGESGSYGILFEVKFWVLEATDKRFESELEPQLAYLR